MGWLFGKKKCPAMKQEVAVTGPNKGKGTSYKCSKEANHKGNHSWVKK